MQSLGLKGFKSFGRPSHSDSSQFPSEHFSFFLLKFWKLKNVHACLTFRLPKEVNLRDEIQSSLLIRTARCLLYNRFSCYDRLLSPPLHLRVTYKSLHVKSIRKVWQLNYVYSKTPGRVGWATHAHEHQRRSQHPAEVCSFQETLSLYLLDGMHRLWEFSSIFL